MGRKHFEVAHTNYSKLPKLLADVQRWRIASVASEADTGKILERNRNSRYLMKLVFQKKTFHRLCKQWFQRTIQRVNFSLYALVGIDINVQER